MEWNKALVVLLFSLIWGVGSYLRDLGASYRRTKADQRGSRTDTPG